MNPSKRPTPAARDGDYPALVRAVRDGDPEAMERLLMRAQEVAWRFSLLVCGGADDAEDAMQDALIKTYRYAARIREPEAFRTWLYRTVKNACLVGRRRKAHEPAHVMSLDEIVVGPDGGLLGIDVEDQGRLPDEQLANARLRRDLHAALQAIPPDYRVIVFLREVEGLSTREVAKIVGISEANVKTRLHRARLMLRQQLEAR
jgi:RNA polymerase sigma-70 factor (ECF subfamily)